MELEGLKRGLEYLKNKNLEVKALITDRHTQIRKWLRENHQNIQHCFDIWHVAKGLKKKLKSLSTKKDCSIIAAWSKGINHHLYWCATTSQGNQELILAKWLSISNHITNKHTGHESSLYPNCTHPPLHKKWFKPGSEAFEKLSDILESKLMKEDIKHLSTYGQTSSIEGFHSVINHFAPKMVHFSYKGMKSRTILAAMHFNENNGRDQATNNEGELQFTIQFPKAKSGGYVVRRISDDCRYKYVDELFTEVFAGMSDDNDTTCIVEEAIPPPLNNDYIRPDKAQAVKDFYTRYNKENQ